MAELKTKPTTVSVKQFLQTVTPQTKQDDALALLALFEKVTKEKPVMWGSSIIGFGKYQYSRKNETELRDWMKVGFSPGKQKLSVHILSGLTDKEALLEKLGKHKTGSSCLYINKLADVDMTVLEKIIKKGYAAKVFVGQC